MSKWSIKQLSSIIQITSIEVRQWADLLDVRPRNKCPRVFTTHEMVAFSVLKQIHDDMPSRSMSWVRPYAPSLLDCCNNLDLMAWGKQGSGYVSPADIKAERVGFFGTNRVSLFLPQESTMPVFSAPIQPIILRVINGVFFKPDSFWLQEHTAEEKQAYNDRFLFKPTKN